MKKISKKRTTWLLMIFLVMSFHTTMSMAITKGNGGDSYVDEFFHYREKVIEIFMSHSHLFSQHMKVDMNKLLETLSQMKTARFLRSDTMDAMEGLSEEKIRTEMELNPGADLFMVEGRLKDAINIPGLNLIIYNIPQYDRLVDKRLRKVRLLAHELLGLQGIETTNQSHISGLITEEMVSKVFGEGSANIKSKTEVFGKSKQELCYRNDDRFTLIKNQVLAQAKDSGLSEAVTKAAVQSAPVFCPQLQFTGRTEDLTRAHNTFASLEIPGRKGELEAMVHFAGVGPETLNIPLTASYEIYFSEETYLLPGESEGIQISYDGFQLSAKIKSDYNAYAEAQVEKLQEGVTSKFKITFTGQRLQRVKASNTLSLFHVEVDDSSWAMNDDRDVTELHFIDDLCDSENTQVDGSENGQRLVVTGTIQGFDLSSMDLGSVITGTMGGFSLRSMDPVLFTCEIEEPCQNQRQDGKLSCRMKDPVDIEDGYNITWKIQRQNTAGVFNSEKSESKSSGRIMLD